MSENKISYQVSKTIVSGRIIKKYKIPLNQVEELNKKYEDNKHSLESKGAKLAGRLDSELESTKVIQSLPIFETIKKCMNEYMMSLNHFSLTPKPMYNLKIITMWINDIFQKIKLCFMSLMLVIFIFLKHHINTLFYLTKQMIVIQQEDLCLLIL
jgi:hypothetical protein